MSDYIRKSALIEELKEQKDDNDISCRLCMDSMIEIVEEQPTLDETEIIRKAFERVVERLEENGQKMSEAKAIRPYAKHSPADHRYYKAISVKKAIKIVKEECGINE